ncbi:hypothetical protein EMCRGX_G028000 [Ephydatia muelleri]|eukprot:Em0020g651a
MIHLARSTLPWSQFVAHQCAKACALLYRLQQINTSLVAEALGIFDLDIRRCFTECTSIDFSNVAWQQAQLSPSREGLGLHSLLHQSSACFIASIGHSGSALGENHHLVQSTDDFNLFIDDSKATCVQDIIDAPTRQRDLSSKIDDHQLKILFDLSMSPANWAQLLSVSSPHASVWLSVMPTPQLNLHLKPLLFILSFSCP